MALRKIPHPQLLLIRQERVDPLLLLFTVHIRRVVDACASTTQFLKQQIFILLLRSAPCLSFGGFGLSLSAVATLRTNSTS